jgi:site-specific DNA recombinase
MTTATLRCAIYTRVSSDAGLEQDFNSLDAQRESAEAYVKSQAHEGWRLVRERFDDGGFSGGSMERPALQKLMERIRERRIDVVVVYKVDRLTRSLADFAKLVELFDAHKVSFVSVTQSFNTTSSMGRLTLNVLLSFAQFEREVTGERIRDKIAASKRKGIWMGGTVPHGYRVENRKLVIVEEEAAEVRLIFELYLTLASVRALQAELRQRGVKTRSRLLSSGRTSGGVPFTNGPLSYLLANRCYIGEIVHKGQWYPGEHEAIVPRETFENVQAQLAGQRRFRLERRVGSKAILQGRLFNATGEKMSPSYAIKRKVRYHYYASVSAMQSRERDASSVHRVPADAIEKLLLDTLARHVPALDDTAHDLHLYSGHEGGAQVEHIERMKLTPLIESLLDRAIVHQDRIEIYLRGSSEAEVKPASLIIPWTKPTQERRRDILLPTQQPDTARPMEGDEHQRLIRGVARGRRWLSELINGHIPDLDALARRESRSARSIRMTLSLALLDPVLIRAATDGRLPRGYGVTRLADLPARFEDQWAALGLSRPH